MARDKGLEALIQDELGALPGLSEKAMFGGLAWMLDGHLLCGARQGGMLVRLGKGLDGWALKVDGVAPMKMGERQMHGWVRADVRAYGDDRLRRRLLDGAIAFVRSLPAK
jgi:hypothetical protein